MRGGATERKHDIFLKANKMVLPGLAWFNSTPPQRLKLPGVMSKREAKMLLGYNWEESQ